MNAENKKTAEKVINLIPDKNIFPLGDSVKISFSFSVSV